MAKASVLAGVVALLCLLLVLSSAVTVEAGRQWRMRNAAEAAAASSSSATMSARFGKVMRGEVEMAEDAGVGDSKRRSPGGPDPQHH
ncbi:hypothetical protein ACP70R_039336 [Stipagrostis hirtigluma subsp. patula]